MRWMSTEKEIGFWRSGLGKGEPWWFRVRRKAGRFLYDVGHKPMQIPLEAKHLANQLVKKWIHLCHRDQQHSKANIHKNILQQRQYFKMRIDRVSETKQWV